MLCGRVVVERLSVFNCCEMYYLIKVIIDLMEW